MKGGWFNVLKFVVPKFGLLKFDVPKKNVPKVQCSEINSYQKLTKCFERSMQAQQG